MTIWQSLAKTFPITSDIWWTVVVYLLGLAVFLVIHFILGHGYKVGPNV